MTRLHGTGSAFVGASQSPKHLLSYNNIPSLSRERVGRSMTNLKTAVRQKCLSGDGAGLKYPFPAVPRTCTHSSGQYAVKHQGNSATVSFPCSLFWIPWTDIRDVQYLRESQGTFGHFFHFFSPGHRAGPKKKKSCSLQRKLRNVNAPELVQQVL